MLNKAELEGRYTERLAILDETKNLPINAVWDYICLTSGTPVGMDWIDEMKKYEKDVMFKRV